MDIMSIVGILLALVCMLTGMVFDQEAMKIIWTNMRAFFDVPSVFITVGGTIGVMMISFPGKSFLKIGKHMKILFRPKVYAPKQYIGEIVALATEARVKGLLSLEDKLHEIEDPFLNKSLMLVVDSVDIEKVRALMVAEIEQLDERHSLDREFYEKGASYAPAFGMIGTLVGLILMLGNMTDVDALASGMATALITTLYGSILANIIFMPIAAKLKARHDEEFLCKMLIMEGIIAIQEGDNPKFIEEKLYKLLPASQKDLSGETEEGKEKKPKKSKKVKKEKGNKE